MQSEPAAPLRLDPAGGPFHLAAGGTLNTGLILERQERYTRPPGGLPLLGVRRVKGHHSLRRQRVHFSSKDRCSAMATPMLQVVNESEAGVESPRADRALARSIGNEASHPLR